MRQHRVRVGTDPARSRDGRARAGADRGPHPPRVRQPAGDRACRGRRLHAGSEAQCIRDGPAEFRDAEQDHGGILRLAVSGARRDPGGGAAEGRAGRDGLRGGARVKAAATQRPSATSQELRPVTALRGVGESLAGRLAKLGISTVQDLLFLLPLRYEDRTRVVPIGSARAGERVVVEGEVLLCEVAFRGRRQLLCRLSDGSGSLTLRFFHFSAAQQQGLARGTRLRCFGEIRRGPAGPEIVHPEYRRVAADASATSEALTPIYPLTEGLQQGRLRQLTDLALAEFARESVQDWLPASILDPLSLPPLREAIRYLHRPPPDADVALLASGHHPMQRRLAFEELLAHHLSLRL